MRTLIIALAVLLALVNPIFAEFIMDRDLRNSIINKGKVISNTWIKDEKDRPYYIQFIFYEDQFYECRMIAASRENRKVTVGCFNEKGF